MLDVPLRVEQEVVLGAHRRHQLERLHALLLALDQLLRHALLHSHGEGHLRVRVVLLEAGDQLALLQQLAQEHLVILRPLAHGQFVDYQRRGVDPLAVPVHLERRGRRILVALEAAREAAVPRIQRLCGGRAVQTIDQTVHHLHGVVVANRGAPARANARRAVHEHCGENGQEVLRLNDHAFFLLLRQQRLILLAEHVLGDGLQVRVNVTRRRGVLPAHDARAKLTVRHQEVEVVGAHEVLRHRNDGLVQRLLAVVVQHRFRDVPRQLHHLDLLGQVALQTPVQHLALRRLQSVDHGRNRANAVLTREQHQLLVHEVVDAHRRHSYNSQRNASSTVVHHTSVDVVVHPRLALLAPTPLEAHVQQVLLLRRDGLERDDVLLQVAEVLLPLLRRGRAETLVVPTPQRRSANATSRATSRGRGVRASTWRSRASCRTPPPDPCERPSRSA